jgi:hypothetical protein
MHTAWTNTTARARLSALSHGGEQCVRNCTLIVEKTYREYGMNNGRTTNT